MQPRGSVPERPPLCPGARHKRLSGHVSDEGIQRLTGVRGQVPEAKQPAQPGPRLPASFLRATQTLCTRAQRHLLAELRQHAVAVEVAVAGGALRAWSSAESLLSGQRRRQKTLRFPAGTFPSEKPGSWLWRGQNRAPRHPGPAALVGRDPTLAPQHRAGAHHPAPHAEGENQPLDNRWN